MKRNKLVRMPPPPPSPYLLLGVIATILTFIITGSEAVRTEILQPIRSSGDEVALIFIPGHNFEGKQYRETALAIQEASDLRLWVVLTSDYSNLMVDHGQVRRAVKAAIKELDKAGMTSKNYIGITHGRAGQDLQSYARNSDLKAIVLMGSYLPRNTMLRDYPIPVLTLCAELDGVTRITRIATEYKKLADGILLNSFEGVYRNPVIFIEGTNHAQFASGWLPPFVQMGDLWTNISYEQAHSMIGEHVNNFLTATFSSSDSQVDKALEKLSESFFLTVQKFQPFLDMKKLGTDGHESLWTILAQEFIAGEYADKVAAYNEIMRNPFFIGKAPVLTKQGDSLIAGTATLIHDGHPPVSPVLTSYESPSEIDMKLVSREAIKIALNSNATSALITKPHECRTLNQLALSLALMMSTEKSSRRYSALGRPIQFEEDEVYRSHLRWASRPLQMWEEDGALYVRSVALVTPSVHYCKVLSPYRAMEWVNIDSLRDYQG